MPTHSAASRRAAQCLKAPVGHHVWISDDLLSDAFHRFVRISTPSCKRYGSNVPGPLEARSRLAKRRMMGLSEAGAGGAGPGFGALFGAGKPADLPWKWEAPAPFAQPSKESPSKPSKLPQWLQKSKQFAFQPDPPQASNPISNFEKQLLNVSDIDNARRVMRDFKTYEEYTTTFCRMAFEHLSEKVPFESLLVFVQDSHLNPPDAKLFQVLLRKVRKTGLSGVQYGLLVSTFERALVLGTADDSDIIGFLNKVKDLTAQAYGVAAYDRQTLTLMGTDTPLDEDRRLNALARTYMSIWDGISSCRIRSVDEIDANVLRKLAGHVAFSPRGLVPVDVKMAIYRSAFPLKNEHLEPAMHERLAIWNRWSCQSAERYRDTLRAVVVDALREADSDGVDELIASTTWSLLRGISTSDLNETSSTPLLESWLSCLRKLWPLPQSSAWRPVYDMIASRHPPDSISHHFSTMRELDVVRIVLRHWIAAITSRTTFTKLEELFYHFLARIANGRLRPATSRTYLVYALTRCGLRLEKAMILGFVKDLFHQVDGHWPPYRPEHDLENFHSRDAARAAVRALFESNPSAAAALSPQVMDIWLDVVPDLKIRMVAGGLRYVPQLSGLLNDLITESNNSDRAAVSCELGTQGEVQQPAANPCTGTIGSPSSHLPLTAAKTLEEPWHHLVYVLAFAFAHDTRYTHRQAFRRVYDCYCFLRARQVLWPQPMITKALVWSGVIRPLREDQWVSTMKFRWILQLVRSVEGNQVADRLDQLIYRWRGRPIRKLAMESRLTALRSELEDSRESYLERCRRRRRQIYQRGVWSIPRTRSDRRRNIEAEVEVPAVRTEDDTPCSSHEQ